MALTDFHLSSKSFVNLLIDFICNFPARKLGLIRFTKQNQFTKNFAKFQIQSPYFGKK